MSHRSNPFILSLCLIVVITLCLGETRSQAETLYHASWALLVGINRYEHLPPQFQLRFAVNDAVSMRQLLIDRFGFPEEQITLLKDEQATKQGIEKAMSHFANVKQIHNDDRVLIYFSGHGQTVTLPDGKKMGFLIPYDAKVNLTDETPNPSDYYLTGLGMNRLRELSSFIPAKHVLFLVDACYSGLAVRSIRSLDTSLPDYLDKVANLRARQIITAGLSGEKVFEEGGHGVFTYKLLEALERGIADQNPPDNVTTATELATYLSGIVPAYSNNQQHPHMGRFDGEGEFIFQHGHHGRDDNHTPKDIERPIITILEPPGFRRSRSFTVEPTGKRLNLVGVASDNVGVTRLELNGKRVRTSATQYNGKPALRFEHPINATESAALEIYAADAAGNSEVITLTLNIERPDTEPPRIEITEPIGLRNARSFRVDASDSRKSVRLAGIAYDNVGVIRLTLNGKPARATALGGGRVEFETTVSLVSPSTELEILAYDAAGHVGKHTVIVEMPTIPVPTPDDMVLIPAGMFWMGSPDGEGRPDEHPRHKVYLDAFYIDRYEVTNAQFKRFVDANPHWHKDDIPKQYHDGNYLKGWNGSDYPEGRANYPVAHVSWYAAVAYARWAGKRLPTEAEWEKAARGEMAGQKYPWGNSIDKTEANYRSNAAKPVGTYPPNGYGLYDMAGNVWEWCLDEYDDRFYASRTDRNPFAGEASLLVGEDFTRVTTSRVLRGGSWDSNPINLRVATRNYDMPTLTTHLFIGFRCVKSATP